MKLKPKNEQKHYKPRVILPAFLVLPALKRLHDGIECSHLGRFKTLRKVQARFWRPGLASDVKDYFPACLRCTECKPPRKTPKAPLHPIPSTYPMQREHIDIIGPLPRNKRGNPYIMTVQCSFTKWVETHALANQRAKTCARALVDSWVYRYGASDSIHSDQGRNFESWLFSALCQMLEIKKFLTTAYHTAGNGQVENANKTVKSLLMAKVDSYPETCDQHLGPCLMAYRSSEHSSTGYNPYSLIFGREVRLPLDVMMCDSVTNTHNHGEYVSRLKSLERFELLERTTEVNYLTRKPSDPRSRSKIVHFNNLKLYQGKQGESTLGQDKDSEGCGTVTMDSQTDGEEGDELPADLFPSHEIP